MKFMGRVFYKVKPDGEVERLPADEETEGVLARLFGRAKAPAPLPPALPELERLMASVQDIPITPTGLPDETIRKVAHTYIAGVNGFPPPCPCAGCLQVYSVGVTDRQVFCTPVAGSA